VDLILVGVRVQAEQPDRAGVRPPQPDSAFDGGGFTRPFGPKMPKISPSATVNETSSTATSVPYVLRRCATSTAGRPPRAAGASARDPAAALSSVTMAASLPARPLIWAHRTPDTTSVLA